MYKKFCRGDIWFVKGGKAVVGSEPYGDRPAVIVSNNKGNKSSPNVEVVYLTTKDKKYLPTHARVLGKSPSVALCENVQTVPKDRLMDYIRTCSKTEMKRIDKALLCSFGLENTEDDVYKKLYEQLINKLALSTTGGKR